MQGICLEHKYRRDYWYVLPIILTKYEELLGPWKRINFQSADKLSYESKTLQFVNYDYYRCELEKIENTEGTSNGILNQNDIFLSFDKGGLQKLKNLINSPFFPLSDFAFGGTNEMCIIHKNFKVVAPVGRNFTYVPTIDSLNKDKRNTSITGKRFIGKNEEKKDKPTKLKKKASNEISRFDPIKRRNMGELHK